MKKKIDKTKELAELTELKTKSLWHTKTCDETIKELKSDPSKGLTTEEAEKRLQVYGFNELKEKGKKKPIMIFLSQFNDFMIWILIAAAFISGVIVREIADAIVILIILIINALMGFIQEYRAEKAMEALKELATPTALVIRNGQEIKINSKFLVPGDIIKLYAGDRAPADARILSGVNLLVDESLLTGESLSVEKHTTPIKEENISIGDKKNMIFSGTTIVKGRCYAIVVETGQNTEIGKIASLIQEEEEATPLQKQLKSVGKKIGIICIAVSLIVFISGILKGNSTAEMFLVAVALAVASIPEGLPAIVTVSLALGVQRMAKNNAIIRKLSAVETLGSVTVICTDKTGTLTENKMTVRKIIAGRHEVKKYEDTISKSKKEKPSSLNTDEISELINKVYKDFDENLALMILLENAVLCNDAYHINEKTNEMIGDPTETALLEMGETFNLTKPFYESKMPRKTEEPFDSVRKLMTTVHKLHSDSFIYKLEQLNHLKEKTNFSKDNKNNENNNDHNNGYVIFTKGAPEEILRRCKYIIKDKKIEPITKEDINELESQINLMASKAMRNLAFAFKYIDHLPGQKEILKEEKDLVFCGVVGMIDPPRPEVYKAIEQCKRANIKVVMVTGDHYLTAKAIGEELKILEKGKKIVEGITLDQMTDEELIRDIENISIFARVSPQNKVRIVEALKKNNHIVAMTGDGINDAPSLKKADIGIAMGITGTDVSKEASKMILTDDNFATIVKAIKEGRVIFDNLKKFILFLLSCNISEVFLMFFSIVFGSFIFQWLNIDVQALYIPLIPVQILWMNLITDGIPALALGIDNPEKDIMSRKATKEKEQILGKNNLILILWQGIVLTLSSLIVYFLGPLLFNTHNIIHDTGVFQTSVFTTLVLTQLLHAYDYKVNNKGIFRRGLFANKILNLSLILSIFMQLGIIYIPALQRVFKTQGLNLYQWAIIISCCLFSILLINAINMIINIRHKKIKNRKSGLTNP